MLGKFLDARSAGTMVDVRRQEAKRWMKNGLIDSFDLFDSFIPSIRSIVLLHSYVLVPVQLTVQYHSRQLEASVIDGCHCSLSSPKLRTGSDKSQ
jgi:hypothetical protein